MVRTGKTFAKGTNEVVLGFRVGVGIDIFLQSSVTFCQSNGFGIFGFGFGNFGSFGFGNFGSFGSFIDSSSGSNVGSQVLRECIISSVGSSCGSKVRLVCFLGGVEITKMVVFFLYFFVPLYLLFSVQCTPVYFPAAKILCLMSSDTFVSIFQLVSR